MDIESLISELYAAFNRRDVDAALALMTSTVEWPKASEGGRVVGKEAIREYWLRQWAEFDPHVDPVSVTELADGRVEVQVHQVVRTLGGETLFDGEVRHIYLLVGGLVQAMTLGDEAAASGAFRR